MNVVICGAGEVGRHSAEVLGSRGHNVTIIDMQAEKLATLDDALDVRNLQGDCNHGDVLLEAGCARADLLLAVTNSDQVNLLAASFAKGLGTRRTIARVHHAAFFEERGLDYAQHLGIDDLLCPDHATATEIAQTLRSPGAIAVERFAGGQIEMQQFAVSDDAKAVGQALAEMKLPAPARLAAIERADLAFIPDASTLIQAGDIVTLIGESEHFSRIRKHFRTEPVRRQRVMLMGGTAQGVWLARALKGPRFAVRMFEPHPDRAEELAAKLNWVTVLRADPTQESDVLQEERIDQADAFVAVSDDDEHNILAAARAKSMGVQHAIAVLQRPTYLHLIKHVGIDRAFSPRVTAVDEILRVIDDSKVRRLGTLVADTIDVFEVRVPKEAKSIIDKPLHQLRFPPKTFIAAIQRDEDVHVPAASDSMEAGDTVILIGPPAARKELKKSFGL